MDRRRARQQIDDVRALLWEWDAIGVADLDVDDEYDCMIGPLLGRLRAGDDVAALTAWISSERGDHFGLPPDPPADRRLAVALDRWRTASRD